MADTERKLSEARRLFSLRDFLACEALLLQVLETDPVNSKARALSELTAIKLHGHKLYKKLVDPRASRKSSTPSNTGQTTAGTAEPNLTSQAHSYPAAAEGVPGSNQPSHFQADEASDVTADGGAPSAEAPARQTDTIRERTIAALVELFKEKEKKLEHWRDPRFDAATAEILEAEGSSTEASADLASEDAASLAVPWRAPGSSQGIQESERDSKASSEIETWSRDESAASARPPLEQVQPTIPLPSLEIVKEIRQLKHEPADQTETGSLRESKEKPLGPTIDKAPPLADAKVKGPESASPRPETFPHFPEGREPEVKPTKVIRLPQASPFEQITSPKKVEYKRLVERKLEERSEDLKNSEIKTVSIAQIKKYLYQEEYELCARELESIRKRFPDNDGIQAFVENTSKRLSELQRVKSFEMLAKELMLSASFHYHQGKFPEALIATNEVLRVIPEHQQARQFADLVQKRIEKEKKKALSVDKVRYCWACGVAVDFISQYCHHCGHRLS